GGYGLIGYGQCNIDSNSKLGLSLTNPDPWTKRRNHSGGMIESGDGALHRNFELLACGPHSSFTHWWRENSSSTLPWAKAEVLGNDVACPPTFTGTTYNRNFETVYTTTNRRLHHWWYDQAGQRWNDGVVFGPTNVQGPVGFVESKYGPGNFEVVAALATEKLEHWWRDGGGWHQGVTFGSGIAAAGHSLLQSTWDNLELVVVLADGRMQHWWRWDAGDKAWYIGGTFGSGIASPPCMIQGQYGMANENGKGNFELCVALPNGTVQHWWRNNSAIGFPWRMSATFGTDVVAVVALLEGSFGFNLEVVVQRQDHMLQHYWRDGAGWHPGVVIGPA
ncbi:MAG TPA: peptidase C1A, partial [bacterium]|nr:peptidase C1A [bacterium]